MSVDELSWNLVRIGAERAENIVGVVNNRRDQPIFSRINQSVESRAFIREIA